MPTPQAPPRADRAAGRRTIPRRSPFDTLGLEPALLEGVAIRGFKETTPIQSAVIPIALAGHDVIGCAETGTGKTGGLRAADPATGC